jgi:hypothetical protein
MKHAVLNHTKDKSSRVGCVTNIFSREGDSLLPENHLNQLVEREEWTSSVRAGDFKKLSPV